VSKSVKAAATVSPTENEIAGVAYQLWLDNGCPVGSDQEDWFRAEATLKNAPVAKFEDLPRRPSIPAGTPKCWSSSAGRGIGRYGEVNGAAPAGSPHAWELRIEQLEPTAARLAASWL